MNILRLAQAGANLTPGERAFVKLVKGWALTGLVAALVALFQLLSTGSVNVARDWPFVAGAGVVAFLFAAEKYATAQGDAPLATALDTLAKGVSDYGNKPAMPVVQATGPSMPTHTVVTWTPAVPPESTTVALTT